MNVGNGKKKKKKKKKIKNQIFKHTLITIIK
jgi:hypothetical protein